MPAPDVVAIARLRNALEQGRWCNAADREIIQRLDATCPSAGELVRRVREFHRSTARRAISNGAAGVVYAGSGYPADPAPHKTRTTGRVLPGLHVFAYPDSGVTFVNAGMLAHDRVTAATASAADPAGLMGMPEVLAIKGPMQMQLQLVAQYWEPGQAPGIIAAYADLLPSGSSLMLTLGTPTTAEGRAFAAEIASAISMPIHEHTTGDVREWLAGAGLAQPEVGMLQPKDRRCGGVMITATAKVP